VKLTAPFCSLMAVANGTCPPSNSIASLAPESAMVLGQEYSWMSEQKRVLYLLVARPCLTWSQYGGTDR